MSEKKKVFISYSRKDYWDYERNCVIPDNIVLQVKKALEAKGIDPWFDEQCIYHDTGFMAQIAQAIEDAYVFLFISTENSNASPWVQKELALAVELKKSIIPLKVVERYPASVGIWIAGVDYEDYFQKRAAAIPLLVDKVHKEIKKKDDDIRINDDKTKQTAQERLQDEANKLSRELSEFEICLLQLNEDIVRLKEEQELLSNRILLKETSKRLIEKEKKDREQKLGVIAEKLAEKNERLDSVEEPDADAEEVYPAVTPQDLAPLKNEEAALEEPEPVVSQEENDAVDDSANQKDTNDYSFLFGHMDILKNGKAESENS